MHPHPGNTAPEKRPESRKRPRTFGLAIVALIITAPVAPAQEPAESPDSLAARLRRAEAAIEVLQTQIAEQASTGVASRSRAQLELNGQVLVTAFGNTRHVNNVDNPQFVRPDSASDFPARGIGMAIRQTRLGLTLTVPEVLGGTFDGDIDVDFYGGQQPSGGGRTFPLLRLRTARGFVRWDRAELMVGQESPLVAGINPMSPAAIGVPDFAAAGNLWLWLPQVRFGVHGGGDFRVGIQGAVLAPTSGDATGAFDTDNDLAERSQRPFLQSRVFVRHTMDGLTHEIGCGVHQGWLVPANDRVSSRAFACDLQMPVSEWLDIRGEFFTGQALRGLGGGGVSQNFAPGTAALETSGGWAQVNVRPVFPLQMGVGCGGDHPRSAPLRQRNDACAVHASLRPAGPVLIAVEGRRLRTAYNTGRYTNDHLALVTGFEF